MSFLRAKGNTVANTDVMQRIEAILGQPVPPPGGTLNLSWSTPEEARQRVDHIQQVRKDLKKLKQDASQEMKDIRAGFTAKRGTVRAGLVGAVGGSKRAARVKADRREKLRQEEETIVASYQTACKTIDDLRRQLEEVERRISSELSARV